MTNLQELQKEASDLISDILKLEGFNVGDIVEYYGQKHEVIKIYDDKIIVWDNEIKGEIEFDINEKDLKLKQKFITLPMVLEAMNGSAGDFGKEMNEWNETDIHNCLIHWRVKLLELWILRKDNKDCSLFDQKNETIKFIIKVLK